MRPPVEAQVTRPGRLAHGLPQPPREKEDPGTVVPHAHDVLVHAPARAAGLDGVGGEKDGLLVPHAADAGLLLKRDAARARGPPPLPRARQDDPQVGDRAVLERALVAADAAGDAQGAPP